MALRTINYTVTADGISPPTLQSGGMQGEHRATELVFTLNSDFVDALFTQAGDNELLYRIDGYTGAGTKSSTEPEPLGAGGLTIYDPIVYPLENWLTRDGGNIRVYLVISILKDNDTLMDLYSFPALIRLIGVPDAVFTDGENYESISLLSTSARAAADSAKESADAAALSAERTENAKLVLEDGTEIIFLGGDAESALDIELVVDNTVTQSSPNPVQSSAIYAYIEKAINKAKLDAHPVGSYYWSTVDTDPAELFGGTWEQVTDKFILAAGEEYAAGDTGGAAVHAHTLGNGYALIGQSLASPTNISYQSSSVGGSYNQSATHRILSNGVTLADTDEHIGLSTALGGNTGHADNMPPYEVAYCFKRTA